MELINKNAYPFKSVSSYGEAKVFRDTARTQAEYNLFSVWFIKSDELEKELHLDSFNDETEINPGNIFTPRKEKEEFDFYTGNLLNQQAEEITIQATPKKRSSKK